MGSRALPSSTGITRVTRGATSRAADERPGTHRRHGASTRGAMRVPAPQQGHPQGQGAGPTGDIWPGSGGRGAAKPASRHPLIPERRPAVRALHPKPPAGACPAPQVGWPPPRWEALWSPRGSSRIPPSTRCAAGWPPPPNGVKGQRHRFRGHRGSRGQALYTPTPPCLGSYCPAPGGLPSPTMLQPMGQPPPSPPLPGDRGGSAVPGHLLRWWRRRPAPPARPPRPRRRASALSAAESDGFLRPPARKRRRRRSRPPDPGPRRPRPRSPAGCAAAPPHPEKGKRPRPPHARPRRGAGGTWLRAPAARGGGAPVLPGGHPQRCAPWRCRGPPGAMWNRRPRAEGAPSPHRGGEPR